MSTALKLMTVEEFLAWAEGKEGRWELHDGVPVMMSPERSASRGDQGREYVLERSYRGSKGYRAEVFRTAWRSG